MNSDAYDVARNQLTGAKTWIPTAPDTADSDRYRQNRTAVGTAARGNPVILRRKARRHAELAEKARKNGDQASYAHHAGIAHGLLDAAHAIDGKAPGIHLSGGDMQTVDLVGPKGYIHGWIYVGHGGTSRVLHQTGQHTLESETATHHYTARVTEHDDGKPTLTVSVHRIGKNGAMASKVQTVSAREVKDVETGKALAEKVIARHGSVAGALSPQYMGSGKPTATDSAILDARYDVMHGAGAAARKRRSVKLSNDATHGMHVYDPTGDERDQARRIVKGIDAARRRGATKQAKALEDGFVRSKCSRARKMPDGKVRAHSALEVTAGLDRLRKTDLAGGAMSAIDLAGTRFLPDAAAVRKAAAKLSKLPPPLRKNLAARIAKRAKELGITVSLANEVRSSIDLSVNQATRDAARKAGLTFPGTTSYPLAGPDGKFSRAMATKAVRMVGLGNVASKARIRAWLCAKLKANGAADVIPETWPEAKS